MRKSADCETARGAASPGLVCLLSLIALAACGDGAPATAQLPSLGASGAVTVSGISSGGYMAGQYQVAFSRQVSGAGIVAAGPWGCAKGDLTRALDACISGQGVDADALHGLARSMAADGDVDALENLRDSRLFLFRGSGDAVMGAPIADVSRSWFARYVGDANIAYVTDVPAAHGWPTLNYGGDCNAFAAPYIVNCDYDLAGAILAHLYPEIAPPAGRARTARPFDQRPFGDATLTDIGYVYVPETCESGGDCRIHVFFHGCEQSAEAIGTELVANAGFNRWAEANDIVVLYPQAARSRIAPMNPLGCWDWWGYTGENYLGQTGPQLAAIRRMVEHLVK